MVFFNDPVLQDDHAARAVRLAVAIRERFVAICEEWRRRGHVLQVGIGIATGYATMGRIGFEGRYDYGGVGNAIILASRLSSEAGAGRDPDRASGRTGRSTRQSRPSRRRAPAQGLQPADGRSTRPRPRGGGAAPSRPRPVGRRPDGGTDPIDAAAFANLLEMTGGDIEFVDELVDTYLEEGVELIDADARPPLATATTDASLRAAHSLKSSSLNVGALRSASRAGRSRRTPAVARSPDAADAGRRDRRRVRGRPASASWTSGRGEPPG